MQTNPHRRPARARRRNDPNADALIIIWPKGIKARGEIRNHYRFVTDLMVTALEVTGTKFMEEIDGVKQMPVDGISLAYSFNKADAPSARTEQYYEQFGSIDSGMGLRFGRPLCLTLTAH